MEVLREAQLSERLAEHQPEWPKSSFLAVTPPDQCRAFLAHGTLVRFGPGETLIREASTDLDLYVLISSCVKVTAALENCREALLAVRVGGDMVGELAAVGKSRRLASVRACGRRPVEAVLLDHETFTAAAEAHPRILLHISQTIGRKLRSATRRRIDYFGSPLVTLSRVLVELAEDHGTALAGRSVMIGVDLTNLELGSLIGVAESTAQRALRQLRAQNLIDTRGRRPVIADLSALRSIAGPPSKTVK